MEEQLTQFEKGLIRMIRESENPNALMMAIEIIIDHIPRKQKEE